jgi:hypothetical protein
MSEQEEIEGKVEKTKKLLEDYMKLAPRIGIDEKTQKRTIDIFLDDLSKALRELKNEMNN